ncbi:MAG: hypothetical protein PHD45_07070 [Bacteroidales bacterium]|nr:hypothetical protein [Bacteroidales bacterium]
MNRIKTIIAIAVLTVFAVGCTNEDDLDSSGAKFNKKNTTSSSNDRKYPQYEEINYSSGELNTMLKDFDFIVNDESSTLSDMSIEKALYLMEAYVNYGVIDKANSVAKEPNKENRTFTFIVPIEDEKVNGIELKDIFKEFAVNLLTTMKGKAIPLSDMYVKEISATSVTFGLDIIPFKVPRDPNLRWHFPNFHSPGDAINVPASIDSPWGQWFVNQQTYWEQWPAGDVVTEYNVYRYSQKPISFNFSLNTGMYFTYYTGVVRGRYLVEQTTCHTNLYDYLNTSPVTPPTVVYYDNVGIATKLIPDVLNSFSILYDITNAYMNLEGKVLCDYTPKLCHFPTWSPEDDGSNSWSGFFLYVSDAKFAFKHSELPMMNYVTALSAADIYPEL